MTLTPEHRTRLIGWSAATALHLCAGVLIVCAQSWGEAPVTVLGPDRTGVISVSLIRPSAIPSLSPQPPAVAAMRASDPAPTPPLPQSATPAPKTDTASAVTQTPAALANAGPSAPTASAASTLAGIQADRFREAILARIAQVKQYPAEARRAGEQGTVLLRFVVDRDGRLLDAWIDQSSGQHALDEEALAAIRRAAPLPGIPTGLPDKLDLTLAIPFSLG